MPSELLTVAQALNRIRAAVHPLPEQPVPVGEALDRMLARDLRCAGDVPPFASAAMDGYAIEAGPAGRTLKVVGESRAGVPSAHTLGHGEAIRTSTGAALPAGANAVIRQEQVTLDGDLVTLGTAVAIEHDIRLPGEDFAAGSLALAAGTRLGPAELATAVAAGAGELWCGRRPRVAIISTGSELRAPGEPLGPGEIHNSNAVALSALAARCGALTAPAMRLPDDRVAIETALAEALAEADVVVVSGGVSLGPHDHVKAALHALDVRESFWGVAIQPGKPTWFGSRDSHLVFGLPGNPAAAYITFALFACPALLALQGATSDPSTTDTAELAVPVPRNLGRTQAIRVRVERVDGRRIATPNGAQGSNLISSLLGADGLLMVPAGTGDAQAGSRLPLIALPK
jgi:molybdopterin molybdotransferase